MKEPKFTLKSIGGKPELSVRYYKPHGTPKGIIIFVHGVSHGAWCWMNFVDSFTKSGYACFALNLRGHGDSDNKKIRKKACLSDYVDDVARCVMSCEKFCQDEKIPYSKPFILGHSMGGAIVEMYISKHSDKVKGSILFAPATAGGMGIAVLTTTFSKTGFSTAPTTLGWKTNKHLAESNFFVAKINNKNFTPRITDEEALKYYDKQLCSESMKAMLKLTKFDVNDNGHIPILVIGSRVDAYFPKTSLDKTAQYYHCKEGGKKREVKILDNLCHDMMLDPDWEEAYKVVLRFIENNNAQTP